MGNFVIHTQKALDALKKDKNLQLYTSITPPSHPGPKSSYYQVYRDAAGNLYFFDEMQAKLDKLKTQAPSSNHSCISVSSKTSMEGRRASICLAINNLLNSVVNNDKEIDNKVLQSRHPQGKLKAYLGKTIHDEIELHETFMKEMISLTSATTEEFALATEGLSEKDLISKVLENKELSENPLNENLKIAFETRLTKLEKGNEEADKNQNEVENEEETFVS